MSEPFYALVVPQDPSAPQPTLTQTPAPQPTDTGVPAHVAYLSGQWKRRDGHGVQDDLPTGAGRSVSTTQQLDPWARRSPPAVDV